MRAGSRRCRREQGVGLGIALLLLLLLRGNGPAAAQDTPAAPKAAPQQNAQHSTDLPAGPGRDMVMRVCSKCHSPNILVANPRDRQAWEETITKMAGIGAQASDDEFTDILEYLAKYVSPQAAVKVNINKALSPALQTTLGLLPRDADAIVAYRAKNGDFKTLDDVKKVPGIDGKKLDDKKDSISFQ